MSNLLPAWEGWYRTHDSVDPDGKYLCVDLKVIHPFYSRIQLGAQAHAARNGWDMIFLTLSYPPDTTWKDLNLTTILCRRDVARAASANATAATGAANYHPADGIAQEGIVWLPFCWWIVPHRQL